MTQIPIIIPLIVAGVFLGSTWRNKSLMGSWKKAILAGTMSGLLNAGYVFALGLLGRSGNGLTASQQQALPTNVSLPSSSSTAGSLSSILACALTGFLIVMIVYVSAVAVIRYRRGEVLESEE